VALVRAQGGDPSVLDEPDRREGSAPVAEVRAGADARGYVAALDTHALGRLAVRLGAGRLRKEDAVDPTAGLVLHRKPGDPVAPGDLLARLHTRRLGELPAFEQAVREAYAFADAPPAPGPLLLDRYAAG